LRLSAARGTNPLRQPCGLPPPRQRGGSLAKLDFVPLALSLSTRRASEAQRRFPAEKRGSTGSPLTEKL